MTGYVARVRKQAGHNPQPSAAILDSQSVKTDHCGGPDRGYDAGKRIKGHKRHILVDTLGLFLLVVVHRAHVQDRVGARLVLERLRERFFSRSVLGRWRLQRDIVGVDRRAPLGQCRTPGDCAAQRSGLYGITASLGGGADVWVVASASSFDAGTTRCCRKRVTRLCRLQ